MKHMIKICIMMVILFTSETSFANPLEMTSTDFLDKGVLPVLYTCDGKQVPPQLSWSPPAKEAQSLVLIMSSKNKDNEQKYHWVLYNLPPNTIELPELMTKLPSGSKLAKNSWGNANYESPCPDRGGVQSYLFTLYALNKKVDIKPETTPEQILELIKNNIVQTGNITAVYSRWPAALN